MAQWWRVRRGPGQQVGDLPGTHPPGPAGHEATRRSGAAADGASRRNRGVVPGLALDGGGRQLHGCADEAANADFLGYPGASRGQSAFPQARVLGLVDCGTHAVLAASIAPYGLSEVATARQMLPAKLTGDMLVMADRNFYSFRLRQVASGKWQAAPNCYGASSPIWGCRWSRSWLMVRTSAPCSTARIAPGAMVSESVQTSWPLVVSC